MTACTARVQYQGGRNDNDQGQLWFRNRVKGCCPNGLRIGFGALIQERVNGSGVERKYYASVVANCCPGGTNFQVVDVTRGGHLDIIGPSYKDSDGESSNSYFLSYDTDTLHVVLSTDESTELKSRPFNLDTYNTTGPYIEAITDCQGRLRLRTVNV